MIPEAKYKWHGPTALTLVDEEWDKSEVLRLTLTYVGPRAVLKTIMPARGSSVAGYHPDLKIVRVTIPAGRTPDAEMRVQLESRAPEGSEDEPITEPRYERSWERIERPIEQHHKCGRLNEAALKRGLKWEKWEDIVEDDYDKRAGGWTYEEYKELKKEGIDAYRIGAPVVTETAKWLAVPAVSSELYTIGDPPGAADAIKPSGYEWLFTDDSAVEEGGVITRTREWTGARYINTLLYD